MHIGEHKRECLIILAEDNSNQAEFDEYRCIEPRTFTDKKRRETPCYILHRSERRIEVEANYYVGIDWVVPFKKFIHVSPKINTQWINCFQHITDDTDVGESRLNTEDGTTEIPNSLREVNYLQMLLEAGSNEIVAAYMDKLVFIDWEKPRIEIEQKDDKLTPFLVVQFLNLLKKIVRKGLKQSYYKVQSSLRGKVKGKILISHNVKRNVYRYRPTETICEYQEFGTDCEENRFLKKVLRFTADYISNNKGLFMGSDISLQHIVRYCSPAFEKISDETNIDNLKQIKINAFFKEYQHAIQIGKHILKRLAYNISAIAEKKVLTPPFWIDMPRLFELYVYQRLLHAFPNHVYYHFSTYGNELDFLITAVGYEMVIDAKYKLHYSKSHIHNDIRQISGYARLKKVYSELKIDNDQIIDCLIIYPNLHPETSQRISLDSIKTEANCIKAYRNVYKLGINLPTLVT
jgi:5-methylcytosine-specific restriction enzyme subunit McrC